MQEAKHCFFLKRFILLFCAVGTWDKFQSNKQTNKQIYKHTTQTNTQHRQIRTPTHKHTQTQTHTHTQLNTHPNTRRHLPIKFITWHYLNHAINPI